MKKKLLSIMLAGAMVVSLAACGGNGGDTPAATDSDATEETTEEATEEGGEEEEEFKTETVGDDGIKIWVADNVVDFTKEQASAWQDANPEFKDFKIVVEAVGEGDAAGHMITDVQAGADIYVFAQDQIARLVTSGALEEVNPDAVDEVKSANDEGSVKAATVGDKLYAYPITSDNGYFLYYDKSVVKDPSTLEGILKDCESAGKNFYMEINSGWYQTAFFFGTGAKLEYTTDDSGAFTGCDCTYASDQGVKALKAMIAVNSSSAFQNGSSIGEATNVGAIVDGTWDADGCKEVFGDNYACAKLPTFTVDGETFQMSGFGGYKLLGVKPQTAEEKLAACDSLAAWLSNGDTQLARYKAVSWGPSNKEAQASSEVKADEALTALGEQLKYTIPQGQYPGDYWDLAVSLGDSVRQGEIKADASDADLLETLKTFQQTCESYAQ
ncbi:MAG: extracellular solute-binding protein [Lachnospiraceae bacterium]|nr:extracellular solute-binding protein [Lachnospiraceae bacterium]